MLSRGPRQAISARADEPLEGVLARSDQESVVVNRNLEPAERFGEVRCIDPDRAEG